MTDPLQDFRVHGYGITDTGESLTVEFHGYTPYFYTSVMTDAALDRLYDECGVYPSGIKVVTRTSTLDISTRCTYMMLSFKTHNGMRRFARCCKTRYMDDVDPITSFLGYHGFGFVGWYQVPSEVVHVKDVVYLVGENTVTYPTVMCIDIETMCSLGYGMPKPYKRGDTIEMVSMVVKRYLSKEPGRKYLVYVSKTGENTLSLPDGVVVIPVDDEVELIHAMVGVIMEEDPHVITGYNIFGFDITYILSRLKLRLLPLPNMSGVREGTTRAQRVDWSSSAYGSNVYDRLEISGRVLIDLMLYFRRMKLDRYSLDFVSKKFLGEGKKDMSPDQMWMYFRNRDADGLRLVGEYCIHDSVLTLELFDKFFLWTDMCEMGSAMRCNLEDIYGRGEQVKVLNQVIYKCRERDLVLTPRLSRVVDTRYEGAYVLEPTKGIYSKCTVVDFQSLYPSILIAYNLCPSTWISHKFYRKDMVNLVDSGREGIVHAYRRQPVGVLPDLVAGLLSQRVSVKEQLGRCTDDMTRIVLDRRQNALKICANSVYGIMGSGNRYMGHTNTAESVASMGRKLLDTVVHKIDTYRGHKVVYGDTDSCFIHHATHRKVEDVDKILEDINGELPHPVKLLKEKYYVKAAFLTKKRYLLYDGQHITSKGVASARRNYCVFARNLYLDTVRNIFEKKPMEVLDHVVKTIGNLIDGKISHEDLVMTVSIKSIGSYTNVNTPHVVMAKRLQALGNSIELGSRLEYLFVKAPDGKNPRLQGERMYTPAEVLEGGLEVDYMFYVRKQLATPLDELLGLVGFEGCVQDICNSFQ